MQPEGWSPTANNGQCSTCGKMKTKNPADCSCGVTKVHFPIHYHFKESFYVCKVQVNKGVKSMSTEG